MELGDTEQQWYGGGRRAWESPMSASTAENGGILAGARAGTPQPHIASSTLSPSDLSAAVLPPVLGPVMITDRTPWPTFHVIGTTGSGFGSAAAAAAAFAAAPFGAF